MAQQPASDPFADLPASTPPAFGGAPGGNPFPKQPASTARGKAPAGKKQGGNKGLIIAASAVGGLLAVFFAVGIIAAMTGSKTAARRAGAVPGSSSSATTAAIAESTKPVTEPEAKAIAENFEKEIQSGSAAAANMMIPWQRVVELGLAEFDVGASNKRQFSMGAVNGLRQRNWAQIIKTQTGGDVSLLRMRSKDGSPTALYRAKNVDGGIGYFEFSFYRDPTETVKISDIYVFQTGEWMSETINRAAIPFVAHLNRSFMQKLSGAQNDYVKHQKDIQTMAQMAQTSPQLAINAYRKLPATLQGDKTVMILRISVASQMNDDAEYQAAINDFMSKFPNDPAAHLFAIDFYALKNDMPSTLSAIRKLDTQIGGDPALQVLEASVHLQQTDIPQAKAALQKALQRDPEYQDAKAMLANLQ